MTLIYTPRSLHDLQSISSYLAIKNPSASRRVMACIRSTIETLETFPHIGQHVANSHHRQLVVQRYPYLVFYRIIKDDVFITHIRHSARRPLNPATYD
jgi:toxin ParE1/3/4